MMENLRLPEESVNRFRATVVGGNALAAALAAALCLLGPVRALTAQSAPGAQPAVSVSARHGAPSLKTWPGVEVQATGDAWITAFAVSRGQHALPIQVLTPGQPGKAALVKAGARVPVRRLDNAEMLHLVNYGQEPVLVVFSSTQPPDLSAFAAGKRWGRDLMIDTLINDQREMVDLLGKTLYGEDGQYQVVVRGTREPAPRTPRATRWAFANGCTDAATSWVRRTGPDGLGLYGSWEDVDPLVRNLAGQSTAAGQELRQANGAPITLKGGARASILPPAALVGAECRGYRVAWWPRLDEPMPGDTTRGVRSGMMQPRYPGVDAQVGTVPGPRPTTDAGVAPRVDAPLTPKIIVNPAEVARDAHAIRSLQGVPKPGGG